MQLRDAEGGTISPAKRTRRTSTNRILIVCLPSRITQYAVHITHHVSRITPHTGIGAMTWDDVNIQATNAALTNAPR